LKNPEIDQRDMSYAATIKEIDKHFGPGKLATTEVGTIGFYTERTMVDICGLTSSRGQYLTPERMDDFYRDPPDFLLLHDPIWGQEAAVYSDYRFPIAYKLEMEFLNMQLPMQLFTLKKNVDLSMISESQLLEFYPEYQLDNEFSSKTIKPLSKGSVHLDTANGRLVSRDSVILQNRPILHLQGWALDLKQCLAPKDIFIMLVNEDFNQMYSLRATRYSRHDIVEKYKNQLFDMCGFQATGVTTSLPSGMYKIQIIQQIDNIYYYFEFKNQVKIINQSRELHIGTTKQKI
jgi:hypothetical protein